MTVSVEPLRTSLSPAGDDAEALSIGIDASSDCAQASTASAEARLGEEMVAGFRQCITTDLNCTDTCAVDGRVLPRRTGDDVELTSGALATCRDACCRCAEAYERHSDERERCRVSVEASRRCQHAFDWPLAV